MTRKQFDGQDRPRLQASVYMRCLLERLATAAGMDTYLAETRDRRTITGKQAASLSRAYTRDRLGNFDDEELFQILLWFAGNGFDVTGMYRELIAYMRGATQVERLNGLMKSAMETEL